MVDFVIRHNKFDSGLLAEKVGQLELTSTANGWPSGDRVESVARAQGYRLVALKSSQLVKLRGFDPVGIQRELSAHPGAVFRKLPQLSGSPVRSLEWDDWPAITELLKDTPPTRFGNDPRLSRRQVIEHKLRLLKAHRDRQPWLSVVAEVDAGTIGGFQVSRMVDGTMDYYELCVAPRYRRGVLAARMLRDNLERMLECCPKAQKIVTRVYDDNQVSMRFFGRLGFEPTTRYEYWYHGWFV